MRYGRPGIYIYQVKTAEKRKKKDAMDRHLFLPILMEILANTGIMIMLKKTYTHVPHIVMSALFSQSPPKT
tara:strand:+ start:566 stop:778 length:213 start_codon:yes stop_codon:yes gene_type:complete